METMATTRTLRTTPIPSRPAPSAARQREEESASSGRRWANEGRETMQRLQTLYLRRIALAETLRTAMEACRHQAETARHVRSKLARIDGDLAEIDAVLEEGLRDTQ